MIALLLAGCHSPQVSEGRGGNFAPVALTAPDVRTEATIIQMENQYIADKNSQPTHQHEAEERKRKNEEEAKQQEQQKQEQATKTADTAK